MTTKIRINGTEVGVEDELGSNLLGALRDQLGLTGSKYGCGEEGQCGACTVLIDGRPTRSCITSIAQTAGKEVLTIEGLEDRGSLHPLQEAFLVEGALQCGYCTPGMIMSAVGLLQRHPQPSQQQIVRFMEGNLCRCGVYPRIVAAIVRAAAMMRGSR